MTIDSPEVAGGQSGALSHLPTPTTTQTSVPGLSPSQAQFTHNGHHSNKTVTIVGGVGGGIVLTIVLMLWQWRQRIKRRNATRAAAAAVLGNRTVPLQEKVSKRNRDDPPPDVVSNAI